MRESQAVELVGISASAWIERLVMRQTRAVKSAKEAMPGLFDG
jgi:hypothetical protein